MTLGPFTLVIQSEISQLHRRQGANFVTSYSLPNSLHFDKQYYARLVWLGGVNKSVLVFADFVQRQHVNGSLEPYLGCSASSARNGWVPLASNHIPAFGVITVRPAIHASPRDLKLTIVIEIAHGAEGTSRL